MQAKGLKWEQRVQEDNIDIKISKDGSPLSKEFYVLWGDYFFEAYLDYSKIVQAIVSPFERQRYDKEVEHVEKKFYPDDNIITYYSRIKPAVQHAKARDFVEKYCYFKEDGDVQREFYYVSSVPDSFKPSIANVTRSYTLSEFMVFERVKGGGTRFQRVYQKNFNFSAKMQQIGLNNNINSCVQKEKTLYDLIRQYVYRQ
mmetsp:Transcript_46221/g.33978  ORF Transcript_46221/g.33978 Transcript_46221/m.33978 type:complete len:200 (-) Transcript_46221:85-684(-)|eukprot:CAMPEP_0202962564 /NCGR_PEP_ID=MMETSP1396-20130829/6673_1 /ASSEMBLY_ACC=CAM_ASM_000872 /TAXON_ID= /ORGANISM="Pseudokeronopsis sp., Strain Brazil" /LENGTH=199 /DNA_ID=CAMNT_0049683253 /DNA_START=372 /DNA_END=971 /DNA_ORIENTATION=-